MGLGQLEFVVQVEADQGDRTDDQRRWTRASTHFALFGSESIWFESALAESPRGRPKATAQTQSQEEEFGLSQWEPANLN